MSTSDTPESSQGDASHTDKHDAARHDKLAQLLAAAGPRQSPPARIEAEVRAAVHAEWLHLIEQRKLKRQRRWLSAAAMLVCAIGAGWILRSTTSNPAAVQTAAANSPVAIIAQLRGAAMLNDVTVASSAEIHANDVLRTREAGSLRIELHNGVSLRVAANSELHWLGADSLQLTQGAVYVDSHANTAPLTIHTQQGEVTHVGTRYMVDVDPQSLHVAVREGNVAIHADHDQLTVGSLQQVRMGSGGDIVRSDLLVTDAMWQWADALAQPFALENRSVAEFLQWVASETGCEVNYVSAAVKAAASSTVLHGQTSTQAPLQAMQAVLATTDFHASVQGRQLIVVQQH